MPDGRRRTIPEWLKAGALAATAAWLVVFDTPAQEATPTAQPPATCQVALRSPEQLAAIVAVASPVPELRGVDAADDPPHGEPADAETAAAIADAAGEYAACLNAADYPRVLALMSERSVRSSVQQWGGLADLLAQTGTPSADADGSQVIKRVVVSWVRVLPDGRVGAVVEWKGKNVAEANFEIFIWNGERWLLDAEISGFVWTEQEEAEIGSYVPAERRAVSPGAAGAATPIPGAREKALPAELVAVEVDRIVYVEPTMADATFRIEAIIFGPVVGDDVVGDVTCSQFTIERGTSGTTVSAQCRAAEGMIGHDASLTVMASGPRGRGGIVCEDAAPLAAEMVLSCTGEDPVPAS